MDAVKEITFKTKLSPAQVVARHCYAQTYEKKYVEEWEEQLRNGMWGGRGEADGEANDAEQLRPT